MSRFQATVGTVSALLTIGVTVATVYYNIENKKQEDFANQQKIQELEQRLNEKPAVVTEPPAPAPVVAPEPTTPPATPLAPMIPPAVPTVVPPTVPVAPSLPNTEGAK
jgi:hypothetical protein